MTTYALPEYGLSATSRWFAHWMFNNLNNPLLLAWFIDKGFCLNDQFRYLLSSELKKIESLAPDQIQQRQKDFPNSIPRNEYLWIWRLVANGYVMSRHHGTSMRDLASIHEIDDKSPLLESDRLNLQRRLTPAIELKKEFQFDQRISASVLPDFARLFSVDLTFRDEYAELLLDNYLEKVTSERRIELFPHFENALITGLNLLSEANGGNPSLLEMGFYLPAIEKHEQNIDIHDWTQLVRGVAYAWLDLDRSSPTEALAYADKWMRSVHPVLKRMALFAAANGNSIKNNIWLNWLVEGNGKNIFDHNLKHEVHRLIDQKSASHTRSQLNTLCRALLAEHRQHYRLDISDDDYHYLEDRTQFFLLN